MPAASPADVLAFWFDAKSAALWFAKNDEFDRAIIAQFTDTLEAAARGELDAWRDAAESALALVIVLDQFPRNMFRGNGRAFAYDKQALAAARAVVERGFDRQLTLPQRMFCYLPFQHAEDVAAQDRAVELMERWAGDHDASARADADDELKYAYRHREIIQRFGRFPHRNITLGRTPTPEELEFLKEPNSSF